MSTTPYGGEFFDDISGPARRAAERILPLIARALHPRSVVDVGCGTGEWLAAWMALGVTDVVGVDGSYVSHDQLVIPVDHFRPHDLRESLKLERRFDLAMSLEVAEHLPPERGESFVADLVALAPAVLFSAAIPGQRGVDHINERWQDYWCGLFAEHGYVAADIVRPIVWSDPAEVTETSYAQNTILYLAPDQLIPEPLPMPTSVAHPRLFAMRTSEPIGLRDIAKALLPAIGRNIRRWLGHQ